LLIDHKSLNPYEILELAFRPLLFLLVLNILIYDYQRIKNANKLAIIFWLINLIWLVKQLVDVVLEIYYVESMNKTNNPFYVVRIKEDTLN
jgi:hypothetical protein